MILIIGWVVFRIIDGLNHSCFDSRRRELGALAVRGVGSAGSILKETNFPLRFKNYRTRFRDDENGSPNIELTLWGEEAAKGDQGRTALLRWPVAMC